MEGVSARCISRVESARAMLLVRKYPDLQIVGHRDGYFTDTDAVVREINDSGAQLLFVVLGSPKQEQWIIANRARISASFLMGVGGSLDVASGRVKWAPGLCRMTGTEWLYRLIRQPSRASRQLVLPLFAWHVIRGKMGLGISWRASATNTPERSWRCGQPVKGGHAWDSRDGARDIHARRKLQRRGEWQRCRLWGLCVGRNVSACDVAVDRKTGGVARCSARVRSAVHMLSEVVRQAVP